MWAQHNIGKIRNLSQTSFFSSVKIIEIGSTFSTTATLRALKQSFKDTICVQKSISYKILNFDITITHTCHFVTRSITIAHEIRITLTRNFEGLSKVKKMFIKVIWGVYFTIFGLYFKNIPIVLWNKKCVCTFKSFRWFKIWILFIWGSNFEHLTPQTQSSEFNIIRKLKNVPWRDNCAWGVKSFF